MKNYTVLAIVLAIVAIILFIPIQMLLPFPFGLGAVIAMWIMVVVLLLVGKLRSPTSSTIPTQTKDNTQFWVCPNCGGNTQMKDNRQYCPSCKIYLSI